MALFAVSGYRISPGTLAECWQGGGGERMTKTVMIVLCLSLLLISSCSGNCGGSRSGQLIGKVCQKIVL